MRIIEVWAFRMACAFEFKITRFASYTLVGVWSRTRLAFGIARATPVIVGLVRIDRTVCVTLIVVEYQVMFATSTMVGTTFTTSTVWTASDASALFRIFKVSVRALLQANGQIGNPQVSWSACQTAVLSGSSTGLARLVTWPAYAAFVRETAGWTTADTSVVELKVSTADALRGSFAVTAKGVALGVAVVQNHLSVNRPFGGGGLRV